MPHVIEKHAEIDESLGQYGGSGKPIFAMPNTIGYFLETVKDKQ
jgi:hypothetical protein